MLNSHWHYFCMQMDNKNKPWNETRKKKTLTRSTSPTVMATALASIPIKPAINRDRLPVFSTRKICRN